MYDITLLSSEVLTIKITIMSINLQIYNTVLKTVNVYKLWADTYKKVQILYLAFTIIASKTTQKFLRALVRSAYNKSILL